MKTTTNLYIDLFHCRCKTFVQLFYMHGLFLSAVHKNEVEYGNCSCIVLLMLHNWDHLLLHNSHVIAQLRFIFHANFVTGIEGRDRADPSQPYSLKEVRQRHAQLGLFLSPFFSQLEFIMPGIHAREWISPATVTYVMNELITNPQHGSLLNMFDFFILPVTNPDGSVICCRYLR